DPGAASHQPQAARPVASVRAWSRSFAASRLSSVPVSDFFRARFGAARLLAGGEAPPRGQRYPGANSHRLVESQRSSTNPSDRPWTEPRVHVAPAAARLRAGRSLRGPADRQKVAPWPAGRARRDVASLSRGQTGGKGGHHEIAAWN